MPPRGDLEDPEYYANGPDIPAALRAIDRAQDSAATISEELDAQLVGLARLIAAPGERGPATRLERLTLASDLHNNLLALPALERAVDGGPLVFAGDLTDRGSPFEAALTARVARIGRAGGVRGGQPRLRHAGPAAPARRRDRARQAGVRRVAGLQDGGYPSPERAPAQPALPRPRRRRSPTPSARSSPTGCDRWSGKVDVVVAHEPGITEIAVEELRARPAREPARAAHRPHPRRVRPGVAGNFVELNGGSAGGGGTGNLAEDQPFGIAVLLFDREGGFRPRFADTVEIDADSGAARAERLPVDPDTAEGTGG